MTLPEPQGAGFGLFVPPAPKNFLIPWLALLLAGALQAASLAWPVAMPHSLVWLRLVQGQAVWWGQLLALST
ncbi:MAG: apolipoprotein N-acyltransferase, partial [Rhodoferax sp.]|nr:apolipoprotein N-acyltransferase [Rhodoferax sp.]